VEPVIVFAGCALLGLLSLALHLACRRSGEGSVYRRAANTLITLGFRNAPSAVLAGAAFWFVCAIMVPVSNLGDPWIQPVGALALVLSVVSVVVLVWWSVRPPRWTVPGWHHQLLEARPKPILTRRAKVANRVLFGGFLLSSVGAFVVFSLSGPAFLWVLLAACAIACLTGQVLRDD
jgi:hypothetical protein